MGLEAINFSFCNDKNLPIREIMEENNNLKKVNDRQYVYATENLFWIDIELQNEFCLSFRIALCNPIDDVLSALDQLLLFLFSRNDGILNNLSTKEAFNVYNEEAKDKIVNSYKEKKAVFKSIYGDYTAAVSSEEFYRIQGRGT